MALLTKHWSHTTRGEGLRADTYHASHSLLDPFERLEHVRSVDEWQENRSYLIAPALTQSVWCVGRRY